MGNSPDVEMKNSPDSQAGPSSVSSTSDPLGEKDDEVADTTPRV